MLSDNIYKLVCLTLHLYLTLFPFLLFLSTTKTSHSNPFALNYDACTIEFEFQCINPTTGTPFLEPQISFDYIFGSEEYYEYVNSDFNDAFAFFLNGQNIALLPDGVTEVTINNVNYDSNQEYFVGNDVSEAMGVQYQSVEADGFTTMLTASATLPPYVGNNSTGGSWNSVKLVIADVADRILDSWVLIEAGSFRCIDLSTVPDPTVAPSGSPTEVQPTKSPSVQPTTSSPTSKSVSPLPNAFFSLWMHCDHDSHMFHLLLSLHL